MISLLVFCLELRAKMLKMWGKVVARTAVGSSQIFLKRWQDLKEGNVFVCVCILDERPVCVIPSTTYAPQKAVSHHSIINKFISYCNYAVWSNYCTVIHLNYQNGFKTKPVKNDSVRCDYKQSNCGTSRDVISKRVPPLILNQNITLLGRCLSKREAEKERGTGLSPPLFTWALQARFPQMWMEALCKEGVSEAAVRLPI